MPKNERKKFILLGIVIIVINNLYLSFAVQFAWITMDLQLKSFGECVNDLFFYMHPITWAVIVVNYGIAFLLISFSCRRKAADKKSTQPDNEEESGDRL